MASVGPGSTSHCRHCGRPVIFFSMFHSKVQGEKARRNIWVHHQDNEIDCPKGTEWNTTGYLRHGRGPKAEPVTYCTQSLNTDRFDWYGRDCHRPVKDEDLLMCGIHARRVHEEKAKREAEERQADRDQMVKDGVAQLVARLRAHGLESAKHHTPFDSHNFRYIQTGKVILDPEELVELLDDLQELF